MVEYKTIYVSSKNIDETLNDMATKGWVIQFITYTSADMDGWFRFALTFKG